MHEDFHERLEQIAIDLRKGEPSPAPTIREFLSWIDAKRRGYWIVYALRKGLTTYGLVTEPDFESAYIDSPIVFKLASHASEPEPPQEEGAPEEGPSLHDTYQDPTYRVSKLQAANHGSGTGRPGEPDQLAGLLGGSQRTRTLRRGVRGLR